MLIHSNQSHSQTFAPEQKELAFAKANDCGVSLNIKNK